MWAWPVRPSTSDIEVIATALDAKTAATQVPNDATADSGLSVCDTGDTRGESMTELTFHQRKVIEWIRPLVSGLSSKGKMIVDAQFICLVDGRFGAHWFSERDRDNVFAIIREEAGWKGRTRPKKSETISQEELEVVAKELKVSLARIESRAH
jgi:hypothetical protein